VPIPETSLHATATEVNGKLIWFYVPESHKTQYHGKPRIVALGLKAQELIKPFLKRAPDTYLFSPRESAIEFLKNKNRQIGVTLRKKKHRLRHCYSPNSYQQTVKRAIDRGNARIAEQNQKRKETGLPPLPPIPHWAPNQLRHSAATLAREQFSRETAAEFLGHSGLDMIDRYAERAVETAAKVAAEIG
jgi:integrase